jgi:glycosyltransferase involved in cell wall biosynthesis
MRVVLMIPALGPGGAERVITLLAAGLVNRGHEVWLVTLTQTGSDFFTVDPRVRRLGLGLVGDSGTGVQAVRANLKRVVALRRIVRTLNPHSVVSFMTSMNVLALLACAFLPVRLVVSERTDPAHHVVRGPWAGLRALTYRRADALVVQTGAAAQWFRERLGRRPCVAVILNPIAPEGDPQQGTVQVPGPFILAAGRLGREKGFDILIRAFATIAKECGQLRLVIAGEGPESHALRDLVGELRLDDRVLFLGRIAGLRSLMRQADAFILSSRYEGFPNVLLEALASGVPVVATDCPSGPREILRGGEFGLLVPCDDPAALAAALRRIVTDTELRARLSGLGSQATAPYQLDGVVAAWEAVLSEEAKRERLP